MQTIAPAASGHEPTRVLVNDDDFVFLHDVFHVELVKRISLEQLRDRVNLLRLCLEIRLQFCFRLQTFARVGFRARINVVQQRRQIRQHKCVRVFRADKIAAFLGQIRLVTFFVNRKQQFLLLAVKINFLLIFVQLKFGAVHHSGIFRVFQNFHQPFGFRLAGFDAEQKQTDFMFQFGRVRDIRAVGWI